MFRRGQPGEPFGPDGLQRGHDALGPALLIWRVVLPLLFLLFLVLVAVLLYRLLSRSPGNWGAHHTEAMRELEMRYARGEISREEFLTRRHDLASPAIHSPSQQLPPPPQPGPPPSNPNPPPASSLPPATAPPSQTPGQAPAG